jgi:hypothetical protein
VKLSRRHGRLFVGLMMAVAVIGLMCMPALAQCPLCKLAVENSTQGKAMGRGLNMGILVLLIPPVTVFCTIFVVAMKHRKAPRC